MNRFRKFLGSHQRTLYALLAAFLFSVTVTFAVPPSSPYTPGATLDPQCAPGSPNCSVSVSSGVATSIVLPVTPQAPSDAEGKIIYDGDDAYIKAGPESTNYKSLTESNDIDVFLIAGQSNAEGRGVAAQAPTPKAGTAYQYYNGSITAAVDPVGGADTGSAWPQFAITYNEMTGRKVLFVPAAVGGASMVAAADNGTGGGTWDTSGAHYATSVNLVQAALAAAEARGYTPRFKGVLWSQGEQDARKINEGVITGTDYTNAFTTMRSNYRSQFGATLPFFIFRTGSRPSLEADVPGYSTIREVQEALADNDQDTYVVFRNAVDFPARSMMIDASHYTQPGYNEMGRIGAQNVANANKDFGWKTQSLETNWGTSGANTAGKMSAIVTNTSTLANAYATLEARNALSADNAVRLGITSTNWPVGNIYEGPTGFLSSEPNITGGLAIMTKSVNSSIRFYINQVSVTNNERMRIADAGITVTGSIISRKTTGDATGLTVSNATTNLPFLQLTVSDNTSRGFWGYDGSDMQLQSTSGRGIKFSVNNNSFPTGASAMYISSTGNVGIGSTATNNFIEAYKSATTGIRFSLTNDNAAVGAFVDLGTANGSAVGDMTRIVTTGTGFTTSGAFVQDSGLLIADNNLSGGLSIVARNNAGVLRFYTGGSNTTNERMRIDSAGLVGIGTASAAYRLDVLNGATVQTADNRVMNVSNAGSTFSTTAAIRNSYGGYFSSTSTRAAGANNLNNIGLYAEASGGQNNYGLIVGAGLVGIGTADPLDLLHVQSVNGTGDGLTLGTTSVGLTASTSIDFLTNTSAVRTRITGARDNGSGGNLQLWTGNSGGTITERMRIDSNGYAGIGTSAPTSTLEVYGTSQTTAALTDAGVRTGILSLNSSGISTGNGGTIAFGNSQSVTANSVGFAAIKGLLNNGTGNTTGHIAFATRNAAADTALTERMRITNTGFVGIANTAPSVLFHVGSAVTTTGTTVTRFENAGGICDVIPSVLGGITCSSDMTLKKNISLLSDGSSWDFNTNIAAANQSVLANILALTPVSYNWNAEAATDARHAGFIAQEVRQLFPDLVTEDVNTGLLSLNYSGLIPYTVQAIKEMDLNITDIDNLDRPNTWRESLVTWLGSATNGITNIFSKKVTTDQLCVGTACVTQQEFLEMIQSRNNPSSTVIIHGGGGAPADPVSDDEATIDEGDTEEEPAVTEPTEEIVSPPAETPIETPAD